MLANILLWQNIISKNQSGRVTRLKQSLLTGWWRQTSSSHFGEVESCWAKSRHWEVENRLPENKHKFTPCKVTTSCRHPRESFMAAANYHLPWNFLATINAWSRGCNTHSGSQEQEEILWRLPPVQVRDGENLTFHVENEIYLLFPTFQLLFCQHIKTNFSSLSDVVWSSVSMWHKRVTDLPTKDTGFGSRATWLVKRH